MRTVLRMMVGILLLPAASLFAQWQNVAPRLLGGFSARNEAEGAMIFREGMLWIGRTSIWLSQDTGKTWKQSFMGFSGNILDISTFDKNTCAFSTSTGKIYLTRDGGSSWELLVDFPGRPLVALGFFDRPQHIIAFSTSGISSLTHDGGMTWSVRTISAEVLDCKAMGGANMYVTSGNTGIKKGAIAISTDYGETWTQTPGQFDHDSYSFDVNPCKPGHIYVVNEDYLDPFDQWSSIFRSTDNGVTWQNLQARLRTGDFFCGSITSGRLAYFVQTNLSGVLRSTDDGLTWDPIGGPSGDFDTRLVTAVNSNIIFAVDKTDGSVYKTINSGGDSLRNDGPIPEWASLATSVLFELDTVAQCDSSVIRTFVIRHHECTAPQVLSETISGPASGDYDIPSGAPSTLSGSDTVSIQFDPTTSGKRNAFYELRLTDGRIFRIDLLGTGSGLDTVRYNPSTILTFDTLSVCDPPRLRTIYISYIGCNPRKKVSESIQGSPDFTIVSSAPDSLGNNDFVRIAFRPTSGGEKLATYVLTLSNGETFSLSLKGYGKTSNQVTVVTTNQKLDTLGIDVHVPIGIEGLDKASTVEIVVHYDTTLNYMGSQSVSGIGLDIAGEQYPGRSKLRIPASEVSLNGTSGYAVFAVIVDSFFTPRVWFDSLMVSDAAAGPCAYENAPAISLIALPPGCDVPMISKFFFHGAPPTLSIKPNPTSGGFSVRSDRSLGEAQIQLFDQIGKVVFKKNVNVVKDQPVFLNLDLAISGCHRLVLTCQFGTWSEAVMVQK